MPTRGIGSNQEITQVGGLLTTLCDYTLATYTAGGTTAPADGDYVMFTTANWRVVRWADDDTGATGVGRVKGNPNTTDLRVTVEWFNIFAFVNLECDDATTVTLCNSCIKDGNTTVAANVDAGAASGNLIAVNKSATSGAIDVTAAVLIHGK